MADKEKALISGTTSDEAVKAKTGKVWQEWFELLDSAGAAKMGHTELARYLREKHVVAPWWSQMVANTYEQARGKRQKHELPEGYQIGVSKTFERPVPDLYAARDNARIRKQWLDENGLEFRKATLNKSLRITWVDGKTSVDVDFYPKGDNKCQMVVQHQKLPNAQEAERMKAYWKEALERLQSRIRAGV